MKKKNKKEKAILLSEYELDNVVMSARYCIGRHTIAAHCHASDIANNTYGRITSNTAQFMSYDICREIYDRLHYNNFLDMGYYGCIPNSHFKPLDVLYQAFNELGVNDNDKLRKIKCIQADYDKEKSSFSFEQFATNQNRCINYRSVMDITDLEVWQRLANLLDLDSHKWCRLIDDKIVEYYEYWRHCYEDGELKFEKIKAPIQSYFNFSTHTYIPLENIKEDNISTNNISEQL